jgi:hypothetical protein
MKICVSEPFEALQAGSAGDFFAAEACFAPRIP